MIEHIYSKATELHREAMQVQWTDGERVRDLLIETIELIRELAAEAKAAKSEP